MDKMKTLLEKDELMKAVHGIEIGSGNADCFFCDVQTDSRMISQDSKTMFVPLIGEFQDGHKYIPSVLEKNPGVILLNNSEYNKRIDFYDELAKKYDEVCFIKVENTLHALQAAAKAYVEKNCSSMIKVSITGSSGKTTTKEMLVSICKEYFGEENVAYTKGNFNSETGLPLSVFKIKGNEKIGIFEMGMNRFGEIEEISDVWKSKYGIITNIGTAHIGILKSRENIAREKRHSFDFIPENGAAFVPFDDDFADFCLENVKGEKVKFGKSVPVSESGVEFGESLGLFGTDFLVDGIKIHLSLSGEYNYQNALGVVALAKKLGIDAVSIKQGIENVCSVGGRMEILKTELKNHKNCVLIKDCYNANLDSMLKVLDFCQNLDEKTYSKKIFVLADMKELGEESEKSHKAVGEKINSISPAFVVLIGHEMKVCYDAIKNKENVLWFEESSPMNFEMTGEKILEKVNGSEIVLLKGSHSMELDKLIPYFVLSKNEGEIQ